MTDFNLLAAVLAVIAMLGVFAWHVYSNSLAIECWLVNLWSDIKWRLGFRSWRSWWEGRCIDIAWLLPRSIAYWAFIRVFAHATQVARDRHPDDLTYNEVAKLWEQGARK